MSYLENLYGLKGKVAILTGAGALGAQMATGLANAGVKVAILNRTGQKAFDLAKKLTDDGLEAKGYACDVLSEERLLELKLSLIHI